MSTIQKDIEELFIRPLPVITLDMALWYLKNFEGYSYEKVEWGYNPPYNKYKYDYYLCNEDGIKIRRFTYNNDTNYSGGYIQ